MRRALFGLLLFSFILPSGTLLLPQTASGAAFGLVPCALKEDNPATDWKETGPCTLCHFLIGMNFVVKLLRNIMTACAIAVIVAMAIVYITSAGDEGRMTFAKTGIKYSLIGFIVILLAWVMVNFIFTLPIFATNGLVRTDWDTFTCNTTSQVSWGTPAATSGIGNATGNPGSGQPDRKGLPGPNPGGGGTPTCNVNGVCDAGETCTLCPSENCGGCIPPTSFGCGAKHYECINGDVETPLEFADEWMWTCRGTKSPHFGEGKLCRERKPVCGDGLVNQPSEQCDAGIRNGDYCPAICSMTCQAKDCGPPPTGGAACGRVEVNNNAAFCAEGIWIGGDPIGSPTCTFTATEIVCRWQCQSVDGKTTVRCSGSASCQNCGGGNGQSCNYPGGLISWGDGCGADVGATTLNDGQSRTVTNTNAGLSGSVTYRCTNGAFQQVSATCN